eukprot:scpid95761/ scgid8714/ 
MRRLMKLCRSQLLRNGNKHHQPHQVSLRRTAQSSSSPETSQALFTSTFMMSKPVSSANSQIQCSILLHFHHLLFYLYFLGLFYIDVLSLLLRLQLKQFEALNISVPRMMCQTGVNGCGIGEGLHTM